MMSKEKAKSELEDARGGIAEVDAQIASLFCRRMELASRVAECKKVLGLPVFDASQEEVVLKRAASAVPEKALREHYLELVRELMRLSKAYQSQMER